MTASDLLSRLSSLNIQLWVEAGNLRFRAPKGVLTPMLREELASHKQEILNLLLKAEAVTDVDMPIITPVPRDKPLPLSFAQQRLWFLDQLTPGSTAYLIPLALRLEGPLDAAALAQSLNTVIARHEALRTSFREVDGVPVQQIAPVLTLALPLHDLTAFDAAAQDAAVQATLEAELRTPFNLQTGPLLRAQLLRLHREAHILLLTLHHSIADGWSLGPLLHDLTRAYTAACQGQAPTLPLLPIQVADVAVWQRQVLQGKRLDDLLAFWRTQLAGTPPALALPTDFTRPSTPELRGARVRTQLPAADLAALDALAQAQGVTRFMLLLAALQVLLARWSGQDDLVIGTPVANRTHAALEPLIGFFVNTLALRGQLPPEITFSALLRQVRQTCLAAYAHQDLPFEQLVEALQPDRSLGRSPLFQVMLSLQDGTAAPPQLPGVRVTPLDLEVSSAKFELTLNVFEQEAGLRLELSYAADLFHATTATRLLHHYQQLLRTLVATPDAPVWRVPLLTAEERAELLAQGQAPTLCWLPPTTVLARFAAQVARQPDAIALVWEGQQWTYAALDQQASRLAQRLLPYGIGPDHLVALWVERSPALVLGALAVLKAGGAYLPLDPALPPARLQTVLHDAAVALLLIQPALAPALEALAPLPCPVEYLADGPLPPVTDVASLAPPIVWPAQLVYAIYTSGSTGIPKGVLLTHGGLSNLLGWYHQTIGIGPGDRLSQLAGLGFDGVVFDVWPTLTAGATLVLPDAESTRVPQALQHWLDRAGITVGYVPTPLTDALCQLAWPAGVALRKVLTGGDVLRSTPSPDLPFAVVNNYGPTEVTMMNASVHLTPAATPTGLLPPIGIPIVNTTAYVLDAWGELVPAGVAGELAVGGVGLARGYLQRPDLTAEKFVPDLFSGAAGARLYRTGDRVRWRRDGTLEFLGRIDRQVKLRGYRIELGEIEAVLGQQPGVAQQAVLLRPDAQGEPQLVAYVVPRAGATLERAALRAALQQRLPAYMLPSAIVVLDQLPLTVNGKLDQRALPAPDWHDSDQPSDGPQPQTPSELLLAQIWAEVLGVNVPSIDADFFALGGHSLRATQVISRVQTQFGLTLPLQALFETPTIAGLAAQIDALQQQALGGVVPPPQPVPRDALLPLSFAQQRLWFLDQLAPGGTAYLVPLALRLEGPLDVAALAQSLNAVIARHEALRTSFPAVDGVPVQQIAPVLTLELPLHDLTALDAAEQDTAVQAALIEELQTPFDLQTGPLLRAQLLRLTPVAHIFLLTLHHSIADGWSLGPLLHDLIRAYTAASQGHDPTLPPLAVQAADVAVWQRQVLQGNRLANHLAFWQTQLADAPPVLALPTDFPRPSTPELRGARVQAQLAATDLAALDALAQAQGVTRFMLLLAALQVLLARWSGQDDLVIGTPVANRTHAALEPLIGFFVNTLALRGQLPPEITFSALLQQVRQTCLDAYAHQDLPFEQLVEALQPDRTLGQTPLFQVMLSLQDSAAELPVLPDLRFTPLELEPTRTKFLLTWTVIEQDGGLRLDLNYAADLFHATTATRLLHHYQQLLRTLVATPEVLVWRVPLLTAEDQAALRALSHPAHPPLPSPAPLLAQFAAQVARQPDALALVYADAALSYAALAARSYRLAQVLRAHGVGPQCRVGLLLDRSLELIPSLLAVLVAGGAYVPLDPRAPTARLTTLAAETDLTLLLTTQALAPRLPASCPVLCLDDPTLRAAWATAPAIPPPALGSSSDLAYVIATSGSTGTPKGVLVAQSSLLALHHALAQTVYAELPGPQRVSLNGALTFDTSVKQWVQLLSGHTLLLLPDAVRFDGVVLATWITAQGLTVLDVTPTQVRLLLAVLAAGVPAGWALRGLLLGGEAVDGALWQALAQGPWQAYNLYGPTECTVDSTSARIDPTVAPTLGRPLPHSPVYVLDATGELVPPGVAGEIVIGGTGVAWGYLQRPDLTAAKFVPDPFSGAAGTRLYRTGDRGRWRPDGTLEFLGRLDRQVKLRGVRIELGEIEAVLGRQPGVAQCVVLLRPDGQGEPQLVAYVVPTADTTLDPLALRQALQQWLPAYLLPSAMVVLAAFPRTAHGKLDERALPPPQWSEQTVVLVPPRTPNEGVLAQIWAEVLGGGPYSVTADFFALGGHSLRATQVISRIRARCGVELPLRALFETPTIVGLAAQVDALQQSVPQPLTTSFPQLSSQPQLQLVPRDAPLPLSFAQQRLWFLDQLAPGGTAYLIPLALRLEGPLDVTAMAQSLNAVVARHEVLRTSFPAVDGVPVQQITPVLELALPLHDITALDAPAQDAAVQATLEAELRTPFNLQTGPLLRAHLLRLSSAAHVLLLTLHHSIADGWSLGPLLHDLTRAYTAACQGQAPTLPPLPIQVADVAVWQRQVLQGTRLDDLLAFWRTHLADAPPALALPTDFPRPSTPELRGARVQAQLAVADLAALDALAQAQGVTRFMLLLAALQVLLARWSGQDDLVIGTPVANRTHAALEPLIGFFVNTLALRGQLPPEMTFSALLQQVRQTCLAAYAHQDLPFEQLVEALQPDRSLGRSPLFQVMLAVQNAPIAPPQLSAVRVTPLELDMPIAKFELTLTVVEQNGVLLIDLSYAADLFHATTAERLLHHYQQLLRTLVVTPHAPVWRVPLLTAEERVALLDLSRGVPRTYRRDALIHDLVEAQALHRPDAIALVAETDQISYRELNRRANQLAHYLRRQGVQPDQLLGLCVERSLNMVIGLLGILKAGAAYLPLDPGYPAERLAFMLDDAQVSLLLVQQQFVPLLSGYSRQVICLDSDWVQISAEADCNLPCTVQPNHLSYAIYTSGSTGRPKGTLISHRNVVRLVENTNYARLAADEVFLAFAPISFDASTFEVWACLASGARLVIAPPYLPALHELGQVLVTHGVTILWLTAGLFHQMVDENLESLRGVRQLLSGGDVLSRVHVRRVLEQLPHCRMINGYGPTESTTFASFHTVTRADTTGLSVPIGQPIAHTTLYVVDTSGQLAPIGVPGELYIGGDGLARGYLQRPDLTAAKFVPDPFSGETGARLYRTGDRVRWRPDGTLEFLGRIDRQVKLRGFRIELGEIETVLGQQPEVAQSAVLLRPDAQGEPQLVVYVVPRDGATLERAELRATLQQRLPAYMLPSAIVVLDQLPLTVNGKLDQRALPAPDRYDSDQPSDGPQPQTPSELLLAQIWAEVLGVDVPSIDTDFFALGGHSLRATQVISRVQTQFGLALPLRALFETPTIAGLAAQIDALQQQALGGVVPPPQPVPRDVPLPLSFAQQRLWFLDQLAPGGTAYLIPLALRLEGPLDVAALARSLNAVVARHEALRTSFPAVDGVPVQQIAPVLDLALPLHDLSMLDAAAQAAALQTALAEDLRTPFNLQTGPLLRAQLLRLDHEAHVLLLTLHHSIADGWSLGPLLHDLTRAYTVACQGQDPTLPPLPIQAADVAVWQRQVLQGSRLEQHLAFWRAHLADAPPVLALPTDFPRPSTPELRGARVQTLLAATDLAALDALAQAQGVTRFMLLLAALQVLLARWSGQDDLVIGTPVANRTHAALEPLIGFFVNTLALRGQLPPEITFSALLHQVRQTCLAAYAHQDLPFEQLVEALQPDRTLGQTPLFQVMLVVQNATMAPPQLPDLRLTPLELEIQTTKFLLTWTVIEQDTGLSLALSYAADLFHATTATRLLHHYQQLLRMLVATPHAPVWRVPLLTAEDQVAVRALSQPAHLPLPAPAPLLAQFAAQVARQPDALALVYADAALTYAALAARSYRLAQVLRAHGVGPQCRVGLLLDRSLELIPSLLAVLVAGGAYVPLDPRAPTPRLTTLAAETDLTLLLTTQALAPRLPAACPVLCLDDPALRAAWAAAPAIPPPALGSSSDLAYVIATSGSTGTPKGVLVAQSSLLALHHALAQTVYAELPGPQRVSLNGALTFDTSVKQWVQLLSGHTLLLLPDAVRFDGAALAAWITAQGLTVLDVTPTQVRLLLAALAAGVPAGWALRGLLLGGEAVDGALWQALAQGPWQAYNLYGPTECTVDSTSARIDPTVAPTLGRPLPHSPVYVLDATGELVPPGVAGEIVIGGTSVAWGYLQRPDLTAAKFVPDPFSGAAGTRLYRTGDRGRWRPEGTLEFLGRLDRQVKLRGVRIELGEIEAVLGRQPGVAQCVVVLRPDGQGEPQLVAYVVPTADTTLDPLALRQALQQWLPAYLLPSAMVVLAAFPRTAHGKLDERALPPPQWSEPTAALVLPRTPNEGVLAQIWAEVLGGGPYSVTADFFALGGHSLRATQVISRIRARCGVELPLRALFETPTIVGLAAQVDALQQQAPGGVLPPPQPVPRDGPLPLSFAQQRLWFLDQLAPGGTAYLIPLALRLEGPLDVAALAQSLNAVVARHEALRTSFPAVDGVPVQQIAPVLDLALALHDLTVLDTVDQDEAVQATLHTELRTPFNLQTGPLLRAQLLRLHREAHVLLLTLHHSIADGWSLGPLLHDLTRAYTAACQGQAPTLPPLPIQVADVAVWQRQVLQGTRLDDLLAFWRTHLADAPPALALPTDFPRPSTPELRGARVQGQLAAADLAALDALAQAQGVTRFMLLLAALQVLLARWSGQDDLVIGTPVANRTHAALEPLIGFFVNTLALRGQLPPEMTFSALLQQVRQTCLAAYAHQDLPFEQLVEALQPDRSLGRSPLFQVMLAVQNMAATFPQLPELRLSTLELDMPTAKFELALTAQEQDGVLLLDLSYAADLFHATTAERLLHHYQQLLRTLVATPDAPVWRVPLLTVAERAELLAQGQAPTLCWLPPTTVLARFAAQVARQPDAIAVVWEGQQWTYAVLDQQSSCLAQRLRLHGVGPDRLVALWVERSPALVLGALAVLKAGGAYLPLDPALPAARLQAVLHDAAVALLLTQPVLAPALESIAPLPCPVEYLADGPLPLGTDVTSLTPPTPWPSQLVYAIYTSGSTGTPKGVGLTHGGLSNLLGWYHQTVGIGPGDRLSQLAGLGFDGVVFDVWPTLTAGATLVLPDAESTRVPQALQHWLDRAGITVGYVPTPLTDALCQLAWPVGVALRMVLTGGDVLRSTPSPDLPFAVVNNYGPTEVTMMNTSVQLTPTWTPTGLLPPIGTPIVNTTAYVLDAWGDVVPAGVAGELAVGGVGLARGYLQRPDLTAEKFVPDPFSGAAGARLYRTGDRVRWRRDGTLEFLGRIDRQVKLRGYRIELGEIEAVLGQQPGVAQQAVVLRPIGQGEPQLVAYVVPRAGATLEREALRTALQQRLPAYMLPSAIVVLDQLPLTVNGKLDQRALPAPDLLDAGQATDEVLPRDTVELQLAQIWEELLQMPISNIHHNFFALGGHSLLAVRLMMHIQHSFGQELPLSVLFTHPTIEQLAHRLRERQSALPWSPLVNIQLRGARRPFFCVHPVGGGVLCYADLARHLPMDRPFYGLQALGLEEGQVALTDIATMARNYVAALRTIQPTGPYLIGGWSLGGIIAFEMAQQLQQQGETVSLLALLDSWIAPESEELEADESLLLLNFARDLLGGNLPDISTLAAELAQLSFDEQFQALLDRARQSDLLPPDTGAQRLRRLYDLFKAHRSAWVRYRPAPYAGRLLLIRAAQGSLAQHSDAVQAWSEVAADLLLPPALPGNHYTLLTPPNVQALAALLQDYLAQADAHDQHPSV